MQKPKLPIMPKGEGSFSWVEDKQLVKYRKTINGVRKTVYGETVRECMNKMKSIENGIIKQATPSIRTLSQDIVEWHTVFKAPGVTMKPRSFDREFHTINNQVLKYDIANLQTQSVGSTDIQVYINNLISDNYSYSTVKKAYEVLSQFFRYYYVRHPQDNPMLLIKKPKSAAMNKETKEIQFLDESDVKLFCAEALRTFSNGKPVYRTGSYLVFLMSTGLRVNEATALRWTNVDLAGRTITISGNYSRVIDHTKPKKEDGSFVYKDVYSNNTKTRAGMRTIYLTDTAYDMLVKIKEQNPRTLDTDLIMMTDDCTPIKDSNVRRALNAILSAAECKIQNVGPHVLRHTFCSLLCRQGIDEAVVATILGQEDREMVKRVYRHVSESEKISAMKTLANICII